MATPASDSFVGKYLDANTRMGELLFGLIMTLTFTLGAGAVITEEGTEGVRQLLIATIGCNVAWGIIDAALYVLGQAFERGRINRLAEAVKAAGTDEASLSVVSAELDQYFEPITSPEERRSLYLRVVERARARVPLRGLMKEDFQGAALVFVFVFIASLPAALPFLLFDDLWTALRTSNGFLLLMLFFVGYRSARHTIATPWLVGTVFLAIGIALVATAIALGG